ncbi:phosphotransferase [Mycolicibacterium gadium]|uniref:phosphotransferase n=1 Tax=Mycolicibacterium gadium TaxID=1794 RepID=UPI002FDE4873
MAVNPRGRPRAVVQRTLTAAGCRYVKRFTAPEHYRRERNALQWLNTVVPGAAPELTDHDDNALTLLTAEVTGPALHRLPQAGQAAPMLALADGLGRIACATQQSPCELSLAPAELDQMPSGYRKGRRTTLALAAPERATQLTTEAERLHTVLWSGPRSLQIGDLCLDNVIASGPRPVLLDWEFAYVGPSVMDLTATLSGFPTCRIAAHLDPNLAEQMIARWNAASGIIADPLTLAAAHVEWALLTTGELLELERAGRPSRPVVANRAARLRRRCHHAATAAATLALPGLHALLRTLGDTPAPTGR